MLTDIVRGDGLENCGIGWFVNPCPMPHSEHCPADVMWQGLRQQLIGFVALNYAEAPSKLARQAAFPVLELLPEHRTRLVQLVCRSWRSFSATPS
jgi:hypothetical protein